MGQWDGFRVKNANICLDMFSSDFFAVFYQKNCVFIIFISLSLFCFFFFLIKYQILKYPQQCINQSETGIGDKKNSQ